MFEGRGGVRLVPGLAVRAGHTIAGKYRVEELIGSGPSGVVISARNIHLREQVTLKILASYTDGQEELLQRRLKKARLAARLQSAHVARIVDIGFTDDGMPYIATEALEGATLEVELAERGALTVAEAARWVLEACEGLAEAHAAGLVHGDLKPQNIFLAQPKASMRSRSSASSAADDPLDTDTRVLKILDFGTTSPLDAIGDQSASAFFGSPAFVAPEQIQTPEAVDARADVWALGVLLYNLVSGSLPFEADSLSGVIVAVVYDAPRLLTDAPYELACLVHRCLDKDPAKRPQDVRELAFELAPFAGSNGARMSERVRAMLDAGSVAPVSLSSSDDDDPALDVLEVDAPLPLIVAKPAPQAPQTEGLARLEQSTGPSRRVRAQQRTRARTAAFAMLGGAAALTLAGWAATRAPTLPSMSVAGPAEVSITSAPLSAADLPVTKAADLPDAPRAPATDSTPTAEVSFAVTSADGMTPTPLAMTPTPLATGETAPFVLPAPRAVTPASLPNAPATVASPRERTAPAPAPALTPPRATTPLRLPPGLPTSRDALPPYGATSARPISRNDAPPAPPAPPSLKDESYLRKLISDRK